MPSVTENLNLFKPDPGQSGVAAELNANYDTLDDRFDPASGHTHDGTIGQGPPIPVTSIAAVGVPSAENFLRGDGQWAGSGGGAGVTDHADLTGLTDDDHPQYHTQGRGDTRWTQRANNLSDLANTATARTNLGAAATVHTHAAADLTSGTIATARLGTGTASTGTFLRGDSTWASIDPGVSGSGLWTWKSAVTSSDPGANNVGVNHDLPASATMLYLNKFAPNSIDYSGLLSALRLGDTIYLQQADNAASWHRYEVEGTPTVAGNAYAIAVSTLGGSAQGTEPANNARVYLIINNAPASSTALTTEQVQDIVGAEIVAGTGITATYDDTAGTVTIASTGGGGLTTEQVQDIVGAQIVGGTGIAATYDDTAGTVTLDASLVPGVGVPRVLALAYLAGALTVGSDVGANITVDVDCTIHTFRAYAKTAPATSAAEFDVLVSTNDGASFASIFASRPQITAGSKVGGSSIISTTALDVGDILRLDVIAAGGTPAQNVTTQLNVQTR